MEPTFAENAAAERGEPVTVLESAFAALVEAWARNDASVPVALVASIFDDLLDSDLPKYGGTLRFDDVSIDVRGVASMRPGLSASMEGLAQLLMRALGEDAPAHAQPMLARLADEAPRDGEELRMWIREALGAPAPHEEVAWALSVILPEPERVLGSAETAIDFAELAEERDNATEIMRVRSAPPLAVSSVKPAPVLPSMPPPLKSSLKPAPAPVEEIPVPSLRPAAPDFEVAILSALPEKAADQVATETVLPTMLPTEMPSEEPVQADSRPVVRVEMPKSNTRVTTAPAARRSAKPALDPRDSLRIPDDRPHWGAWVFVVALVIVGALFWLRYL